MSIKFKSTGCANLVDLNLPRKYYAQIINGDDVSCDELAELISKIRSLNYGEVSGAFDSLIQILEMQLQYSRFI